MKVTTDIDKAEFGILASADLLSDAICMMLDDDKMREEYSRKSLECIIPYNLNNICNKWVDTLNKC